MSGPSRWTPVPDRLPSSWTEVVDSRAVQDLVVLDRELPARPASYAPMPGGLHPRVGEGLRRRGIGDLYTHQAEAVGLALSGHSVAVVTPTASGKSLCYLLP
ncbi:MAG: DEAD/DEAH box helicase, partial [Candidatus Dormibacteria bacterium]